MAPASQALAQQWPVRDPGSGQDALPSLSAHRWRWWQAAAFAPGMLIQGVGVTPLRPSLVLCARLLSSPAREGHQKPPRLALHGGRKLPAVLLPCSHPGAGVWLEQMLSSRLTRR